MSVSHRAFAPARLAAIAGTTFTELTRQKAFYLILFFAFILIGSSSSLARFSFAQELPLLKDVSLGAISIFTSLLAIVATARLLPQDVEDRTVYAILAKPVPRFEYVAGKLIGVLLLLAVSTILMSALFFLVLYLREQTALAETTRQMAGAPPQALARSLENVRRASFNADLLPGLAIIYLKAAILAAVTLLVSTFATSNLFTILVTVFVYFIGHLQATAREFWLQEQGAGWLTRLFLALVALIFPDLQMFDFVDQVAAGSTVPLALFGQTALIGCFYLTVYLLVAVAIFSGREL